MISLFAKIFELLKCLFFKSSVPSAQIENTAIYTNGKLEKFHPLKNSPNNMYDAKFARYIILDGIKYDLENPESILQIKIPLFYTIKGMPNASLDMAYNFQVRLKKEERIDIAVALAYKTAELMPMSPISWSKKDYYRVVIQLWKIGAIKEADKLLEQLKQSVPLVATDDEYIFMRKQAFEYNMNIAKSLNEDYLYTGNVNCCAKCAPFGNRVFSISGKDKRFPKFSDYIDFPEQYCCLNYSGFFYYDGCTLTVYKYDKNGNVKEKEVDALKHSNRPFKDDRSPYQKDLDKQRQIEAEKRNARDANYYNRQNWIDKYNKKQKEINLGE